MRFLNVIKSRNGRKIHFEKIEHKIEEICKEHNINLLYLYGSYVQGVAYKLSDIDIGFLGEKRFNLQQTLYLLSRLQDVFEEEAVELVDLSKAPLTLIHRVLKEGRCLYAKSIRIKIEFEIRCEALYFDTQPLRREYFKALERRIKNGTFGYR